MSLRAARLTAIVGILTTPILALGACSRASASSATSADSLAIPVIASPVESSSRSWSTTASGIIQAKTTVDVAFQVAGKVSAVGPDEGQPVRAGEIIASIDPTDYQLGAEQAVAQADRMARDLERSKPLLAAGSIAPADLDHLESGARQAAAAASLAKKKLADTRLEAPISGIVARRSVEVGATAAPGQAVFTIVDLDPVRVRIGVPESDVGRVSIGAPAQVRVPALDATFSGRVSLIGVAADPTTRSYAVEITVPNRERLLRAGMVAEATITTGRSVKALMVPASAVMHDGGVNGTTYVYTLDADSRRVHARRVSTGMARGDSLEIADGLTAGDRVVVAGQQRLREGMLVQLASSTGSAKP